MEEDARSGGSMTWRHTTPARSISNVPYLIVKYLAIYMRKKLNNVSPKSVLIVLIILV